MTPQQRALVAELRVADYPAAWTLTASASDDKLVTAPASKHRASTAPDADYSALHRHA